MGQAKNRGSFEQRRVQAKHKIWQEQLKKEKALYDRQEQERKAYSLMVWWQLEMTKKRERIVHKRKLNSTLTLLQLSSLFRLHPLE